LLNTDLIFGDFPKV